MVSVVVIQILELRQSQGLIHAGHESSIAPTHRNYPAPLELPIDLTSLQGQAAEKDSNAPLNVSLNNLREHLGAGAVDTGHPVDIEDYVLVVLFCSDPRK